MQNTGPGNGPVPVGAQTLGAGRSGENLMANRLMEEVPLGVLGRECKVPIESMGLFDLCAVKFRIVQRLENNRAAYNLVRMRKPFTDDEESDIAGGDLALSRLKSRKVGGSQQYSDDEKQRKSSVSLAKKTPGVAGSRKRMNWDNMLSEIPNLAYEMQEQSKFKMAEASHLGRKARKEVMKKDNQSKGLKEYKKLLSTQLAIQVTREVRSIVTQPVPVQTTDDSQPSDQPVKQTLAQTMKMITENCQLTSDTPFNIELERLERNKQSCLREIHKVLSKWNKPQVKNFLKSQIFESVETIIEDRTAQNWQWHSNQSATTAPAANMDINSVAGDQSVTDGPARSQAHGLPRTLVPVAPVTSITGGVQMVNTQNVSKEIRKEDLKEREMNKLLKCENADEFSALYLNKTSTTDSYRKIFKTSIEAFSSFPKSFDEVPVAPQASLKEDEMWENKNFFGTQADASMVESGLTQYFDQMSVTAKEFPEIFGTPSGNSGALSFNNHHEKVFEALSKGMMVIYEHLATERGESYNGLDTFIKILNPGRSEHFLDDHISMWPLRDQTTQIGPDFLPYAASLHPLLHYTLHRLENRFGKRWFWIEALLKSNPLFRGYKLSARTIGRLSIFFHMLSGERVLQNHRQQIPGERIVTMEFFPTDVSSKKRLVPGRKPKNRSREKEENDYTAFRAKFEAEKLRLPWNNTPDASIPNELFYNKAVEYLKSRQAVHNNAFKRFKPSRGRQTFSSGIPGLHTAGSSTSANGEPRPERFNDRPPSDALANSEDKGKLQIQNYIKHLKRRREMFIQNIKTNSTATP